MMMSLLNIVCQPLSSNNHCIGDDSRNGLWVKVNDSSPDSKSSSSEVNDDITHVNTDTNNNANTCDRYGETALLGRHSL